MKTRHRRSSAAKRTRRWQADPGALQRAIARNEPFTEAETRELVLPARIAFESLRSGSGEEADYHTLGIALNLALIYSESIDPLCERTCVDAQEALMRAEVRHRRTGRWGLDGPALQSIPPALDLHDQMIALSTPLQLRNVGLEVLRRTREGHVFEVEEVS